MQKYLADLDDFTLQSYKNINILDAIYFASDSWRSIKIGIGKLKEPLLLEKLSRLERRF